jgi:tetratricopeptide (TPR) repeat protein
LQKIEKIFVPFFSIEEINEIRKISSPDFVKENKKVDSQALISRAQIDLLITYSENKLSTSKLIQFLLVFGETLKNGGQYDAAVSIFNSLLNKIGDESKFANIKINSYLAIADIYEKQAYLNECLLLVKKARNASKALKDYEGIAYCENFFGTVYGDRGNIKKAKSHFENSLSLLNPAKDKALIGILEINLGILCNIQGNSDEAFTYFQRALVRYEQTHDVNRIAELKHNIGMLYTQRGEYESALKEFNKSIALSLEHGLFTKIGISYLSKAFICIQLKDYQLASVYANKAMEICNKLNDRLSMAEIYKIKGIIEKNLKKYKLSENYLLTSLRINHELSNDLNKSETLYELGKLYVLMKQSDKALEVFNSSLEYFRHINFSDMITKLKYEIHQIK